MAANFRISVHRSSDTLHLDVMGDFDGTSACELLNALEESSDSVTRVFINTSGLKDVYPFGVDTFQKSLYLLKDRQFRLLFAGENASSITPERNKFF